MEEKLITKIRTAIGELQIDYNALANLPTSDKTLSEPDRFADGKAVGDAIASAEAKALEDVNTLRSELRSEMETNVQNITSDMSTLRSNTEASMTELSENTNTTINTLRDTLNEKIDSLYVKDESGDTIIQTTIIMNENTITGLKDPVEDTDAATKSYVDGKYFKTTATIGTSWSGSAAPYTQSITVSGIKVTDCPHIAPVYSSTLSTALGQMDAWAMVNKAETTDGKITFTCFKSKPSIAIPIQIEVNR